MSNEMRKLINLFESPDLSSADLQNLNTHLISSHSYNYWSSGIRGDCYFFKDITYEDFLVLVKTVYRDIWIVNFDINIPHFVKIFDHGPLYDYDRYVAKWSETERGEICLRK